MSFISIIYYKLRYLCSSEEALNNFVGVADLNTNNLDTEMVPDSNPLNFAPDHTLNFNPVRTNEVSQISENILANSIYQTSFENFLEGFFHKDINSASLYALEKDLLKKIVTVCYTVM